MLNHAQQQAVSVTGNCLITACPGSGKTTVLRFRAAHLLSLNPKNRVAAVTFTGDAAAEIEDRIRKEAPNAGDRVTSGTFHSLCKRQLEKSGQRFTLVTDGQRNELIYRAIREEVDGVEITCSMEDAIEFIDAAKSQVDPILPSPRADARVLIYERYQALLRQMGGMDFSDLIVEAVRGIERGTIPPLNVTHMLVDEAQDCDGIQWSWVFAHANRGIEVTVVGDDDQAIYGWRGAKAEQMQHFRVDAQATHVALNITYRCAREILTPAARLIANNTTRVQKALQTANRTQGEARVKRFADTEEETNAVIDAIIRSGCYGEWGILARTNRQLDEMERGLLAAKIEYHRSGGTSFWELRAPAVFLGLCQSLASGSIVGIDEVLLRMGVGEEQMSRLHKLINSRTPGAGWRFLNDARMASFSGHIAALRTELIGWRKLLKLGDDTLALRSMAKFIMERVPLYRSKPKAEDFQRDARYLDHCVKWLTKLKGTLGQRMLALQKSDKDKDIPKDAVRLMTMHSSKGLEFQRVWLIGCEEGVIPSRDSPIEEERRLFYVALTRGKTEVTASYTINDRNPPSVFLKESGLM